MILNGTSYSGFNPEIARIIEKHRIRGTRLRFHWGDTETGRDWGDIHDVAGYVGRSCGPVKIPILVHNRRSLGGGAIMSSIVRIRYANKQDGGDIYRHELYHE